MTPWTKADLLSAPSAERHKRFVIAFTFWIGLLLLAALRRATRCEHLESLEDSNRTPGGERHLLPAACARTAKEGDAESLARLHGKPSRNTRAKILLGMKRRCVSGHLSRCQIYPGIDKTIRVVY